MHGSRKWVFIVRNVWGGSGLQVRYRVLDVPNTISDDRVDWWYLNEVDITSELVDYMPLEKWGGCWAKEPNETFVSINGEQLDVGSFINVLFGSTTVATV